MTISREEFAGFGLHYDDLQLAFIRSGADQMTQAMREAAAWDSRNVYPALHFVPDVRNMKLEVMRRHRQERWRGDIVEWKHGQGGTWLPEHDPDNPDHAAKMFGISAADPKDLHVLAGEYTVDRWKQNLLVLPDGMRCTNKCAWGAMADSVSGWRGFEMSLQRCTEPPDQFLLLPQGQYLIAVKTCPPCLRWLLAGGSLDAA